MASAILFVKVCVASCEKSCEHVTPSLQLERFFLFVIVALQVSRKIASCNMAFSTGCRDDMPRQA